MIVRSLICLAALGAQCAFAQTGSLGATKLSKLGAVPQYEELGKITNSISNQGGAPPQVSKFTWEKLNDDQRESMLKAMRELQETSNLTSTQKSQVLNQLAAKADITAAQKAAKEAVRNKLNIPRVVRQDELLTKTWMEQLKLPKERPFTLSMATTLAAYKQSTQVPNPLTEYTAPTPSGTLLLPDKEQDAQKIVLPGTPTPVIPGQSMPTKEQQLENRLSNTRSSDCQNSENMYKTECMFSAADVELASKGMPDRQEEMFNPLGFLEVVKIQSKSGGLDCTGTLIDSDVVMTATHCIKGDWSELYVMVPKLDVKELDACQRKLAQTGVYRQCVGFTDHALTPNGIRQHPTADLTLLKLASPTSNPTARVNLRSNLDLKKISMAGYGDNGGKKTKEGENAIEVGWFNGTLESKGQWMEWTFDPEKKNSAPCNGDSGGPIFHGRHVGYDNDQKPREIVSITTKADRQGCKNHRTLQTMLSYVSVKTWLCDEPYFPQAQRSAAGCSGPVAGLTAPPIKK